MSSTNTNANTDSSKDAPPPARNAPSAVTGGEPAVKKTVQTVEVRESAGQEQGQGVLKPIEVVHEIPAAKQDAPAAGGEPTVKKTVQTVEVRESARQEQGQGVLKPIEVVHEIPGKEPAKQE